MQNKKYYIAYGSNLNVHQMKFRCPHAEIVGTAELKNYRLLFKGSKTGSYLTIEPAEGYSVPIAVWSVTEADEKALDRYEGFPNFYYKKEMDVTVKGLITGRKYQKKAFVYIMHEERPLGIPAEYYVRVCLQGYQYFNFDDKKLFEALKYSKEEANDEN